MTTANTKIKPVDDLAVVLQEHKRKGNKIVLCHGVFDLLHVGHLRYFEAARKFGDILVVTLTVDQYVNKGPHRPAFPQDLRAELIAGLACVDYVALSHWPQATEVITRFRPDFYVKGPDYKDYAKDHTGGILLEEAAVKSVGGAIVFTDEIVFSATKLINRYMPVLTDEAMTYLAGFTARYSLEKVQGYLHNAKKLKVLVIGEAIIDEYQYCQAIGKSSKEPTLVVKNESLERFAGGALAVANHVAGFSDHVTLITLLGSQNSQEEFVRGKLRQNIEPVFVRRKDGPTIVKKRLIASYFFSKLMETYDINDMDLDEQDNADLCNRLHEQLTLNDLVIVVDYGHGFLSREAIALICENSRFLVVNAQANAGNLGYHTISMYPCADFIFSTESEIRLEARDRRSELVQMLKMVADRLNCERFIVTRGSNGCLCYEKGADFVQIPAFAGKVVDRIGAGDAFLAVSALCAVQQAPMEVIGFVGNVVGAEAVAMVGNREPIQKHAVMKHIESLVK